MSAANRSFRDRRTFVAQDKDRRFAQRADNEQPKARWQTAATKDTQEQLHKADRVVTPKPGNKILDVLILGAGAAGLMCATRLVGLGYSVCVVDHSQSPGRKLSIAGGGYANFTNRTLALEHYVSKNPKFIAPVLERFPNTKMLRLIEALDLTWEEREKGKIFLQSPAAHLVKTLLQRCRKGIFYLCLGEQYTAKDVRFSQGLFHLVSKTGLSCLAKHLVIALGSPACPSCGASGLGYALAEQFGHHIVRPEAALTPLLLSADSPFIGLQGVSLPVVLRLGEHQIEDDLLFTHAGLSGPAALKASLYWHSGQEITIDFLPQVTHDLFADAVCGRGTPRSLLAKVMPQSLVDCLTPEEIRNRRCAELSKKVRAELLAQLHAFSLTPSASAGLKRAEVCRGGVDTREVETMTFVSRLHPQLSFAGEILDVTGLLGGYNLHWAFASGLLAAEGCTLSLKQLAQAQRD